MKINMMEKQTVTRLKAAKTARETAKGKGNPTNKDIAEMLGQLLDLVGDLHERLVK